MFNKRVVPTKTPSSNLKGVTPHSQMNAHVAGNFSFKKKSGRV